MKIFKSSQVSIIDKYTILNEPISSIDLMERAATNVYDRIIKDFDKQSKFCVIAGAGNNGGDGLVIARLLLNAGYEVEVYMLNFSKSISDDCKTNLDRLISDYKNVVYEIKASDSLKIKDNYIIIDAIFGSGLTRKIGGEFAKVVDKINKKHSIVLSVDIPSGLFGEDNSNNNGKIVKSCITYALEFPSISMMFAENHKYFGSVQIVPIGLSKEAISETPSDFYIIDNQAFAGRLKYRKPFDHKGNFGHLLVVSGSYGKAGAAVLTTKSALRSGAGLVTSHLPVKLVDIMQISVPEAMVSVDENENVCTKVKELEKYNALAIGPGLGTNEKTKKMLIDIISSIDVPMVLDADALNILSEVPNFLDKLPKGTVLTPHPKEFERLFGKFDSTWQKIEFMKQTAVEKSIVIILKGGITAIATPKGNIFFNTGGNPGMATAGSGDVLTGIIGALLAQNYSSINAAILGVFLHAKSGDIAVKDKAQEALVASDIVKCLGQSFKREF